MSVKVLLFTLCAILAASSVQGQYYPNCYYGVPMGSPYYTCWLYLKNPAGRNNYTGIAGQHNYQHSYEDVEQVVGSSVWTTNFPRIFCDSFRNVKGMSFIFTGMTAVDNYSLTGCTKMQEIDFEGNEITSLAPNTFATNAELYYVDFTGNRLAELPAGIFAPLVKLERLNLAMNKFRHINSNWFGNHPELSSINLAMNYITSVDERFLTAVPNFREIIFWDNECAGGVVSQREDLVSCFAN